MVRDSKGILSETVDNCFYTSLLLTMFKRHDVNMVPSIGTVSQLEKDAAARMRVDHLSVCCQSHPGVRWNELPVYNGKLRH